MELTKNLNLFIQTLNLNPIIVCIGSPNVIGDSFGPITGQLLCDCFQIPTFVYGTVLSPVTAVNLKQTLRFIKAKHADRKIIAIDSAVGSYRDDRLRFFFGPVCPGKATGKNLPPIGDFSVTATVSEAVPLLFSAKLSEVYALSRSVASAINQAFVCRGRAQNLQSSATN